MGLSVDDPKPWDSDITTPVEELRWRQYKVANGPILYVDKSPSSRDSQYNRRERSVFRLSGEHQSLKGSGRILAVVLAEAEYERHQWAARGLAEPPPNLAGAIETIRDEVKSRFKPAAPEASIEAIEFIVDALDSTYSLADARLQRLLAKVPLSALSTLPPEWFTAAKASLDRDQLSSIVPSALDSLGRLLTGLHDVSSTLKGEIAPGARGSVEVLWDSDRALLWRVFAPGTQWPGVHVRAFYTDPTGKPVGRSFRYAGSVLSHLKSHLFGSRK